MALSRVKHYSFSFHSVDHEGLLTLLVEPLAKVLLVVVEAKRRQVPL
jgi:hypothetical protein